MGQVVDMPVRTIFLAAMFLLALPAVSQCQAIFRTYDITRPVQASQAMVVAAEGRAAQAGLHVLQEGGNAVDAAVTVGFTLAVTLPRAGNIGGGGFMLIHDADSEQTHALDYREVAPEAAHRDLFLNESGEPDPALSQQSSLAVGVPGTVAGLLEAHERFGSLPLPTLLQPAIELAEKGFPVTQGLHELLKQADEIGRLGKEAKNVFFNVDGKPILPGNVLKQPNLAKSLRRIRDHGKDGFYKGPTARAIVDTLASDGGILSMNDLARYKPVWRAPVKGHFMGHEILSMPPPSSGGVHLIQMLQLLENFPLPEYGPNSHRSVHLMAEVMKRAYADRSKFLGDPDFIEVPVNELLSEAYQAEVLAVIDPNRPTPSVKIGPGILPAPLEGPETTHFSIVDSAGNAVSNTYTLNFSFGSGIMATGTGILLNNEMDDFSAKPGVPNAYGLIGGEANAVGPGKRMLSSMTPTIVMKDHRVRLVTGSPGGSRIINTVLQVIVNALAHEMNIAEASITPRFHHQWLPDILQVERGFPHDTVELLEEMGYSVNSSYTIGCAQSIAVENGILYGASDPRRDGGVALGF